MDMNFGGQYLWAWMLEFLVAYIFYEFIKDWWDTRQCIKKCSGNNILVLMHTIGGQAFFKWCKDEQGSLVPADIKGWDKAAKDLAPQAIAKIKASRQEFGWYAVLPSHVFSVPYPLGSKHPKSTARITEYVENYPMPMITADFKKWDDQRYASVCSSMAEAAKDTGDIRAIISEAAGIEELMSKFIDLPKMIESGKLWQYVSVGEGAVILILVYMVFDELSKLASLSGISAILNMFGIGG